ncbi:hypothetical protein K469DRAFT_754509 [Zopfia rhizophila CBS 207.26]|uniref:Uncharacterized protein n=1 Tax=Zopfia rhizophila CBS 207.26 TaxID=1314779 RepID=A0A6A6DH06_9PEZI|nr:hypothetical protein K469DRAFT_754509 [Zopfia rhizophila CBS 207.26]
MQQETDRLEDEMEDSKLSLFLTPASALPSELPSLSSIRETTVQGHTQFVVAALSLFRRLHDTRPAAHPREPPRSKPKSRQSNPAPRTTKKRQSDSPFVNNTLRRSGRIEKKRNISNTSVARIRPIVGESNGTMANHTSRYYLGPIEFSISRPHASGQPL